MQIHPRSQQRRRIIDAILALTSRYQKKALIEAVDSDFAVHSEMLPILRFEAPKMGNTHKAVQTSGYTDLETYKKVVSYVDYVLQDIKLADADAHVKYTGVSNENILENIEWLKISGKEFVFRVPLIPKITDTEENLKAISKIVGEYKVEFMPYNHWRVRNTIWLIWNIRWMWKRIEKKILRNILKMQ